MILLLIVITSAADTLSQVQILWRHGARTPINCNWNCDYFRSSFGFDGILTQRGMGQHYALGHYLRKKYVETGFLSSEFKQEEIFVQSTDVERTYLSALWNLNGMFTDNNTQAPDINYVYQPKIDVEFQMQPANKNFSFTILNRNSDNLIRGFSELECPYVRQVDKANIASEEYKKVNTSNAAFMEKFGSQFNSKFDISELNRYQDTFDSCIYNNYTMPNISQADLDYLKSIHLLISVVQDFRTWQKIQYTSAPFIQNLLKNMEQLEYKYIIFSGHDTTIVQIALAMNWTSLECLNDITQECIREYPAYASNIIFELYEREDHSKYVKTLYNGSPINTLGKENVEYKEFYSVLNQQSNVSYTDYCKGLIKEKIVVNKQQRKSPNLIPNIVIAILVSTLLVGFFLIIRSYKKRRNATKHQTIPQFEEIQLTDAQKL